ncbi:MAG: HD domain-containing protein [Lachnospiraceae bacterium]|nr:HD domain-containing protein [Lachnospiraceae bacterium]
MYYIKDYKEGEKFYGVYLCKVKQVLKSKAGKTYYNVDLQDKTGVINCKIWDLTNAIDNFEELDFVHVEGIITTFQDKLQVNISRVRVADEGEYVPSEYIPASKYSPDKMYEKLLKLVDSVSEEHLNKLLKSFFVDDKEFAKEFKVHSAAKSMHHGFLSGLLQHSISVASICDYFSKLYYILDHDLIVTAALLHDIGKIEELADFPRNDYTDEGQLLGHIYIGAEKISRRIDEIPGFPRELKNELIHCILAHHGELEFGSPKKPAIAEAMALSFADNIDAKMEGFIELYEANDPNTAWLGFQRMLDSNIRQSSGTVEIRKKKEQGN